MQVELLPAWEDNYLFVIHNQQQAIAIDPGHASIVDKYLTESSLKLLAILNTHHHPDHIGGNQELQNKYKCPIYCSSYDQKRIPGNTTALKEDFPLKLLDLEIQVLETPGHTLGHLSYYIPAIQSLFCGDSLFSLGCGRIFEGEASTLHRSFDKFRSLDPQTKIYCAHEYTLANAKFCRDILLRKEEYQKIITDLERAKKLKQSSIPTNLSYELLWNPFLHLNLSEAEKKKLRIPIHAEPSDIFVQLRKEKDSYQITD